MKIINIKTRTVLIFIPAFFIFLIYVVSICATFRGGVLLKGIDKIIKQFSATEDKIDHSDMSNAPKSYDSVKPSINNLPGAIGQDNISYCDHLSRTDLLVVIPSAADNAGKRAFIRETWGRSQVFSRVLFFVAKSRDLNLDTRVSKEATEYKDILVLDTPDSYHSVTLRLLSIFKWISVNCHQGFIMKVDDDIMIHPENFAQSGLLDHLHLNMGNKIFYGKVNHNDPTLRSGKYGISKDEWPHPTWPDFVVGFCYVMTQAALSTVMDAFNRSMWYVWLEDVYITGILREEGGAVVMQLNLFDYYLDEFKPDSKGGYVRAIDPLAKIIQRFRNGSTGLVDLVPIRAELGHTCFIHMQAYNGFHQEGTDELGDWLWNVVWGLDPQMKNINSSGIDFRI